MNYVIECQDKNQQIEVLEKLEKKGYSWTMNGAPTNFVPLSKDPLGKIIVTKPGMTIAYSVDPKRMKEKYKDSHKYVTGREYLGEKVIL